MFTFLNHGAKITRIPSRILAITTLAVLAAAITALALGSFTAQAQNDRGAVPNLQLSSASPGELTITWDSPNPVPADYRLRWAEESLDFLSYSAPNEANRGSEYPEPQDTSQGSVPSSSVKARHPF